MFEKYYLAVCTLGENPHLRECVEALVQLKADSSHQLEVLVVMNLEESDVRFSNEVVVIFEPARGYSNVRNKAISAIPKDANIVFLDDDEIPSANWLDALISVHENHPEDLIAGPVYAEEGINLVSYRSLASKKYSRFEDGALMKQAPTSNLLIPGSLIEKGLIQFDSIFNFSGSEDTDLCFRLRKAGVKIRFAKFARLYERQKVERFDPEYISRRRSRDIANYSLIVRRNSNILKIGWRCSTLLLRIMAYSLLGVFGSDARDDRNVYFSSLRVLLTGKHLK